ncbi:hypothetical protein BT69DRAFT_1352881 [Atractiella rhizophila]|nr:hypothetical protein BT69DRAFT_1352881 [Atractiella rhizophila]
MPQGAAGLTNKDGSKDMRYKANNPDAGQPGHKNDKDVSREEFTQDMNVIQNYEAVAGMNNPIQRGEEAAPDVSDGNYKPSEHGGLRKDGEPDKRTRSDHGFGSDEGADPHVEGQKGGSMKQTDLNESIGKVK